MSAALHITVLLEEAVEALAIKPDGVYVDGTFGRGGHSRAVLARLGPNGKLIAFDRDPVAVAAGEALKDPRFELVHAPFSDFAEALAERGVEHVDGVLLDLGVSSPQLDEAERGMSFRFDAPLDMRMDTSRGMTAAEWLADAPVADITRVLREYGEERFAYEIAKALVAARTGGLVATTGQLAALVEKTVWLAAGGRLVVISFHSLEDRIVKRFMRDASRPPQLPARLPVRAADMPKPKLALVGKAVRPSDEEVSANPRSRSAVMRVAERLDT